MGWSQITQEYIGLWHTPDLVEPDNQCYLRTNQHTYGHDRLTLLKCVLFLFVQQFPTPEYCYLNGALQRALSRRFAPLLKYHARSLQSSVYTLLG